MVQAGRQQLYVRKVFLATGFILGSLSLVGFTMTNSSVVAIMLYCLERGAVMTASIGGYEVCLHNRMKIFSLHFDGWPTRPINLMSHHHDEQG